jgi:type IV secretion system protein VirD4
MSGLGQKTNASKRYERRPLMEPDDIRLMPLSDVLILTRGKDPIKVRSIKHFEDPFFMDLIAKNKAPGLALIEQQKKEQERDFKVDRLEQRIAASERRATLAISPVEKITSVQGAVNTQEERSVQPRQQPTTNDLKSVVTMAHTMLALNSVVEKLPPNESAKRLGSADIQKPRISPEKRRKSAKTDFALDIQILADATKDTDDGKAQVAAE